MWQFVTYVCHIFQTVTYVCHISCCDTHLSLSPTDIAFTMSMDANCDKYLGCTCADMLQDRPLQACYWNALTPVASIRCDNKPTFRVVNIIQKQFVVFIHHGMLLIKTTTIPVCVKSSILSLNFCHTHTSLSNVIYMNATKEYSKDVCESIVT